jgi:hypothetical protein
MKKLNKAAGKIVKKEQHDDKKIELKAIRQ